MNLDYYRTDVQGRLDTLETRIEDGDIIAAKAKEADFATLAQKALETDLALRALVADRALETDRALTAGTADLALYANTSGSAKTADNATHADMATYADTARYAKTGGDGQPDPADPGSGEEWTECARGIANYSVAGAVLTGWPAKNVTLEWDSSIKAEVWEVLRKSTGATSSMTTSEVTEWRRKRGELIAGRIDNSATGYSLSNVKEARLIELARSLGAKLLGASGGGGGEITAGGVRYPEASNPDKWLDLEVIWYRR